MTNSNQSMNESRLSALYDSPSESEGSISSSALRELFAEVGKLSVQGNIQKSSDRLPTVELFESKTGVDAMACSAAVKTSEARLTDDNGFRTTLKTSGGDGLIEAESDEERSYNQQF